MIIKIYNIKHNTTNKTVIINISAMINNINNMI